MRAEIELLFRSPLFRVFDFRCNEAPGGRSLPEYCRAFEISFTRTGDFSLRKGKQTYTVDTRGILLHNPESEYVVTHGEKVRDTCTVVQINESILQDARSMFWKKENAAISPRDSFEFARNFIRSNPRLDFLHHHVYGSPKHKREALSREILLMEIVEEVFTALYGPVNESPLQRTQHLEMIERAKSFLNGNFNQDLSLSTISRYAYASPFHFSRIFKQNTSCSPYRYLQEVRWKHAALLLRNTSCPVTEICFESGFNSFPHFIASFSRRFGLSPSKFRRSSKN